MTIYDVEIPVKTAQAAITYHFRKHSTLEDGRYAPMKPFSHMTYELISFPMPICLSNPFLYVCMYVCMPSLC
jgi:hypothetical protein